MLAWLMNLGFAAGGRQQPTPPVTPPVQGGGGHRRERRGSVWEPRVELVILEAQARRALAAVQAQEGHLSRQLARKPIRAPEDWRMTPKQEEQVRSALERLGVERKQKQTELDEVLQRILELDREIAEEQAAKTLRELNTANATAAREYKARQAAEVERRVARETALAAARAEAKRETARLEGIRIEAARVEAARVALEARKREEEAIAVILWQVLMSDD